MRRVTAIDEAARVIRAGGVVAIPTDTLYGLAADPFNPDAVQRIFTIKGRLADRAVPLVAADVDQIVTHLGSLSSVGSCLASRFWPGPLTLVIAAPETLATSVSGGRGRVGVRVPAHDVTRRLCRACGRPLTATSANRSGEAAPANPDEVARVLGEKIDLLLDAGPTPGGPPSTIVDVGGKEPRLLRAGAIAWDEVRACARRA